MIYIQINEMLEKKQKSKYWFIKNMERWISSII
nr:MAG TPA: hypothetical protein [Caudoviricetes sp.]